MDNKTDNADCYSVEEFCSRHGISRAFFYKIPEADRPVVIRLGRRALITREAAAAWRDRLTRRAESSAGEAA